MSRGLGQNQRLLISALRAIEAEHGAGDLWSVSYIVQRAYALSPKLQGIDRARTERIDARERQWKDLAAAGDQQAKLYFALGRATGGRSYRGRRREREWPHWIENHINPSRTLVLLEHRGLVTRAGGPGGSWAGLTKEGRTIPL